MKAIKKALIVLVIMALSIETIFICFQFAMNSISKKEIQRTIDYVEQLTQSDEQEIDSVSNELQYFVKEDSKDRKRYVEIVDTSIIDVSSLVGLVGINTKVTTEENGEAKISYDYIQLAVQREASSWKVVSFQIIP